MPDPSSSPSPTTTSHRRHSIADSIHSPTTTLSFDDASVLETDLRNPRVRFSLDDVHDPLNPTLYPHVHPLHPPSRPLLRRILTIVLLTLLWYAFSLLLSLYNKWMFAPRHLNFPFPLFVTSIHMAMQFCLSGLVLYWFPKFRPKKEDYLSVKEYAYFPYLHPLQRRAEK